MKIKKYKIKYSSKVKRKPLIKKKSDLIWVTVITIIAFWICFLFSLFSELIIPNVSLVIAIFVTLFFVFLGIVFDMIGLSVTVADIKTFNSMATKRIRGAKLASKLIKNAEKTSSFCNDVIGDICGIISGATSITISVIIANRLNVNPLYPTLLITAVVAALTIGGKALGKAIAINNSTRILYRFTRVISIFTRE